MKTLVSKPTTITHSLLTLSVGCALACLPLGQALAQDPAASPSKPDTANAAGATAGTDTPATSTATTTTAAASTTTAAKLSHKEVEFIKKAGAGNAAEVKAGQLAQSNGESQDVKDFGAKMVSDHGDANTDLGTIAKSHDITFPPAETEKQKMMYEKLSKLKGAEFDKAYVMGMVADHKKDLAEYKMEKSEAKDADLKAYVDKTETIIDGHLKMIEDIKTKMMAAKKS